MKRPRTRLSAPTLIVGATLLFAGVGCGEEDTRGLGERFDAGQVDRGEPCTDGETYCDPPRDVYECRDGAYTRIAQDESYCSCIIDPDSCVAIGFVGLA